MIENTDYRLIPDQGDGDDTWQVRIISGDFVETVIKYGKLALKDDGLMTFDFDVVVSPIEGLNSEDGGLQTAAKEILLSIMERVFEEKG